MKRVFRVLLLAICLSLLTIPLSPVALADRGMVPISEVSVYGPGQKAIIAWDGKEEILILSTDVRASGDSQVLEILPLPSEPKIEKGDFASFEQIDKLIKGHFPGALGDRFGKGELGPPGEGVEIVFHEKIGAHDITVVKAADSNELVQWADKFLEDAGIEYQISSPKLESVTQSYMSQDINYFAFDLIEVSSEPKSIEPIKYRFDTDFLYYPLTISTLASGWTDINLFLLMPQPLHVYWLPQDSELPPGLRISRFYGKNEPEFIQFRLSQDELASIDESIASLLGENAWLTAMSYHGDLAGLTKDLKLYERWLPPKLAKFDYYQGKCTSEQESEAIIGVLGDAIVVYGLAITPTPCYELEAKLNTRPPYFSGPPFLIVDITAREMPGACIECLGEVPFRAKIDDVVPGEIYDVTIRYQGKVIAQKSVPFPLLNTGEYFELPCYANLYVCRPEKEFSVYLETTGRFDTKELDSDIAIKADLKGRDMKLHTAYLRFNEIDGEAIIELDGILTTVKISPSCRLKIEDSYLFLETPCPLPVLVMPDELVSTLNAEPEYLELREVEGKAIYEFKGISHQKLLGLLPTEIEIEAMVDAATGEIIKQQEPWWAIFCW